MTVADDDLTDDGFLGGRLRLLQPRSGYRAGVDPVLLAAAVPARRGEAVLELGCGTGAAALCLCARVEGLELTGLERQTLYAALARKNAERNGLALTVLEGDVSEMPPELKARRFHHVMANPPYYRRSRGSPARAPDREQALGEATPLAAWVAAGSRRLLPGGTLTVIQQAERLDDLLRALPPDMGGVTIRPLAAREGRDATRIILQAGKGRRAGLRLLAPLILHAGMSHAKDGDDYTPLARAVLRDGAALPPA